MFKGSMSILRRVVGFIVNPGAMPAAPGNGGETLNRHAHLIYTHHARCRMDCRHINEKEVREILEKGDIKYGKSEPNARPDPKYALDGYTTEGQHLRIVLLRQKMISL